MIKITRINKTTARETLHQRIADSGAATKSWNQAARFRSWDETKSGESEGRRVTMVIAVMPGGVGWGFNTSNGEVEIHEIRGTVCDGGNSVHTDDGFLFTVTQAPMWSGAYDRILVRPNCYHAPTLNRGDLLGKAPRGTRRVVTAVKFGGWEILRDW